MTELKVPALHNGAHFFLLEEAGTYLIKTHSPLQNGNLSSSVESQKSLGLKL